MKKRDLVFSLISGFSLHAALIIFSLFYGGESILNFSYIYIENESLIISALYALSISGITAALFYLINSGSQKLKIEKIKLSICFLAGSYSAYWTLILLIWLMWKDF